MRSCVIAILSTACVVNAFWLPQPSHSSHSNVRSLPQSQTALGAQNGWDITKRNLKSFLVPNAKQAPILPDDISPEPVVSAAASVSTPEVVPVAAPVVAVPEVVPEVVPNVPRMQLEPHSTTPDMNTVAQTMQESYKNAIQHMHDAPLIPGHTPSLAEYIKQGKFAGSGHAVGEKLKHLPSFNFEALKDMQPLHFEALKKSLAGGIFGTGNSEGMAFNQILQLKFDQMKFGQMMNSMSARGATISETVDKFSTSFQNFGALLHKDGIVSAKEAIDALDLDELGAYYVGIIGLFILISQSGSDGGMDSSSSVEVDADADVPTQNITAVIETGVVLTESDTMKGQILELTKAITAMSKEMKVLQGEKATRDYEIATMKSDSRSLRNQLDASESVEGDLRATVTRMEKQKNAFSEEVEKLKKEADGLRKEVAAAKAGATGIAAVTAPAVASPKKAARKAAKKTSPAPMPEPVAASPAPAPVAKASPAKEAAEKTSPDPMPKPVAASPAPAPVVKASPPKEALEKASPAPMPKPVAAAPAPAPVVKASPPKEAAQKTSPAPMPTPVAASPAPSPVAKASPVKESKETPEKASPAPMPKPVAASPAPAPAPYFSSVAEAGARGRESKAPFFSSITEPSTPGEKQPAVKGSAKKGAKKETKKIIKKKEVSKESVAPSSRVKGVSSAASTKEAASSDDWSQLSPSTLKRKTVKALTEYLISKGASVTDKTGAALKKSELLEAVRSQEAVRSP